MKSGAASSSGAGAPSRARFVDSITDIDASAWNALAGDVQPFLRHEFLAALEETGCAVRETGWAARHLLLEDAAGRALGAMPLYRKSNSRGEFVFDFSWAAAYAEHAKRYYPKLVGAVPFTPVSGARLLVEAGEHAPRMRRALIAAARDAVRAEGLSSWHVLFTDGADGDALRDAGMILRRDCQFHWLNHGYASFDAFLTTFTAEKRKKVKRERRRVAEAGITFDTRHAGQIDAPLWETIYEFYADTFYRHGHEPYINLNFFKRIGAAMPQSLMVKIALAGATPIAAAIFFVGGDALYGRYWGAGGNYHSLHFEACYYQGIEYCIEHGLSRFEPGTQGEHKVPRGFVPTLTSSAHHIADPQFAAAIRDFAAREASAVDLYAAAVNTHVPYHRVADEELVL